MTRVQIENVLSHPCSSELSGHWLRPSQRAVYGTHMPSLHGNSSGPHAGTCFAF